MKETLVILVSLFAACTTSRESTMPFKNYGAVAQDLSPLQNSKVQKAVRIWVSSSTSIDRVVTIVKDSTYGEFITVTRYGKVFKNGRSRFFYDERAIQPLSSFKDLWLKLDEILSDSSYKDNPLEEVVLHRPISRYVIEYKDGQLYKHFYFETHGYFQSKETNDKLLNLEQLIFEQFLNKN